MKLSLSLRVPLIWNCCCCYSCRYDEFVVFTFIHYTLICVSNIIQHNEIKYFHSIRLWFHSKLFFFTHRYHLRVRLRLFRSFLSWQTWWIKTTFSFINQSTFGSLFHIIIYRSIYTVLYAYVCVCMLSAQLNSTFGRVWVVWEINELIKIVW